MGQEEIGEEMTDKLKNLVEVEIRKQLVALMEIKDQMITLEEMKK